LEFRHSGEFAPQISDIHLAHIRDRTFTKCCQLLLSNRNPVSVVYHISLLKAGVHLDQPTLELFVPFWNMQVRQTLSVSHRNIDLLYKALRLWPVQIDGEQTVA